MQAQGRDLGPVFSHFLPKEREGEGLWMSSLPSSGAVEESQATPLEQINSILWGKPCSGPLQPLLPGHPWAEGICASLSRLPSWKNNLIPPRNRCCFLLSIPQSQIESSQR